MTVTTPSRRAPWLMACSFLIGISVYCDVEALPQGRAWVPTARLAVGSYTSASAPRLEFDGATLRADTEPRGGGSPAAIGLRWNDSTWVEQWQLPYPTYLFGPVVALDGQAHLVWLGDTDPKWTQPALMVSRWVGDDLAPVETVTTTFHVRTEYSACASLRRRWVVVCDKLPGLGGEYIDHVRLFYSDTSRIWHAVAGSPGGGDGVAIAALDDTTAIVVWASTGPRFEWGLLRGREWLPKGDLSYDGFPVRPRMRAHPDGGVWLSWGAIDQDVRLALYQHDGWGPTTRITGNYPRPPHSFNFANDTEMSKDPAPRPVVAWDADYESSGQIMVSFPTPEGYSVGEFVPGSYGGVLPSIARDQNGDVWLTWWEAYRTTWWTHTYTRATASDLRLDNHGTKRTLTWTLSEAAPGSWWTVFCSRGDEPAERVARVQASDGLVVAWRDDSPPAGRLRYRVQRDCLDGRYVWTSLEVAWPDTNRGPRRQTISVAQNSNAAGLPLEAQGLSLGTAKLSLFDLQGRRVFEQSIEITSDLNSLRFATDELPVRTGVYFAQIRDARGAVTPTLRMLVLK